MKMLGVNYYVVSSTTQCSEDYPKIITEFSQLIDLDGDMVVPAMWVTPFGLEGSIEWYLESPIKWRVLKIHPDLHPNICKLHNSFLKECVDIANELGLVMLIHTSQKQCSKSSNFEGIIAECANINIILAHGRPIEEAMRLSSKYTNCYVDSAFMPIEHIKLFVDANLAHKLLWGSDLCIPLFFDPKLDLVKYYNNRLEQLKLYCSYEQYNQITHLNAQRILSLS